MFSDFYFVTQAQNLMDYESEIYSRPKKIWFQTPKEKRQTANVAKVELMCKINTITECSSRYKQKRSLYCCSATDLAKRSFALHMLNYGKLRTGFSVCPTRLG